ncbi:GMP synthase [Rubrivivax gelatinosus]|nr:GMP synthase [Rubrivivax gelatinosus]
MKPVLILQHLSSDGPAYLARWLHERGIAFELRDAQAGDPFPSSIEDYAALAVLGGEMSANDPLSALRQGERLILEAMGLGLPVIGHCLGGQLMARALGARVVGSPQPEIGWQPLTVVDTPAAQAWFGSAGEFTVFQWHYEAFELPPGAQALAGSAACPQQAFTIGPHLALQFHVEIDAEKLERWSHDHGERLQSVLGRYPSVQDGAAMRREAVRCLPRQQALADRLYQRWLLDGRHLAM